MKILKIVACLLFFSFVWSVGYGDIPLKQKKKNRQSKLPWTGRMCYMIRSEMYG